jgi:hypothetical protein
VIASIECGDIDYLISLGVPPKNIIACDLLSLARRRAKRRGVTMSPHHDIVATTEWALSTFGEKVVSVNVDLCCSIKGGIDIIDSVTRIVQCKYNYNHIVVFYTYLRGRDGISDPNYRDVSSSTRIQEFIDSIQYELDWIKEVINYQSNIPGITRGSPMTCLVL